MTGIDHTDDAAVDAFAASVERAIDDSAPGFSPWTARLLGVWAVAGALLTLAVIADATLATVLFVVGLALVAAWVVGFYRARGRARWFGD